MTSEIRIISRDIKNREKDKKFEIFSSTMNCQCIYLGMHEQMTGACRSQKTKAEVHMNTEEKREKIRELIEKIEDDELLSFIYKLIKRLMD